jgi:uncharacterized protein
MASPQLRVLRLNARELLRQPGLDKRITVSLPAAELGVDDDRITGELDIDLHAVSTIDGVTVSGMVTMPWRAMCRRCLAQVAGVTEIDVDEVYQDGVGTDSEAFEIDGDQIDMAPAVREYVLIELPGDPLCRDDCAGICPVCGIDRNAGSCDCDTSVRDERWAALDGLQLDDD